MKNTNALYDLLELEKEARDFGFEWPHEEAILKQAISECDEIREAIENKEPDERIQEEIGDLLHTAISLCVFAGYDTEAILAKVVKKFGSRMENVKSLTQQAGFNNLKGQSTEFMLKLWDKAKDYEYIQTQSWQTETIQKAVKKADTPEAMFTDHTQITEWLNSWGTEDEKNN